MDLLEHAIHMHYANRYGAALEPAAVKALTFTLRSQNAAAVKADHTIAILNPALIKTVAPWLLPDEPPTPTGHGSTDEQRTHRAGELESFLSRQSAPFQGAAISEVEARHELARRERLPAGASDDERIAFAMRTEQLVAIVHPWRKGEEG